MLVLSRKLNEEIVLPGLNVAIQVVSIKSRQVRLGITAPDGISIMRAELVDKGKATPWDASTTATPPSVAREWKSQLLERLKGTGSGLGLLRLELDAGQAEEAVRILAGVQHDFQLILHGLAGELGDAPAQPAVAAPKLQRALLVEDNSNERELLAGFLRHSGLEVDTAGDGADALDYLGNHSRPDVILLDMGLPRVDGATMVRRIRSNPELAGLKIFGVSGHLPEEFNLECGPRGIDRWFHKPVDPAALLRDLSEELSCTAH